MTTRVSLIAAVAGLTALGACTDQYGQPVQLSRAQQGVIAGATAGAIYGATRDDDGRARGRDAIKGAIIGGAAGGLVGSALDAQAQALQSQMTTPGVQVVNTGQTLNVTLPEGVLFAFDSAVVSGPARGDLTALARNLQQYPNSTVQVVGHTDSTGAAAYNVGLSQRRAEAVAGVLTDPRVFLSEVEHV